MTEEEEEDAIMGEIGSWKKRQLRAWGFDGCGGEGTYKGIQSMGLVRRETSKGLKVWGFGECGRKP